MGISFMHWSDIQFTTKFDIWFKLPSISTCKFLSPNRNFYQTLTHNAKTNLIRRATNMLDWDSAFVINKVTEKVFNF